MAKTSLTFFPNKEKKNSRTGKIPMFLRIGHGGKKAEAALPIDITDFEFQKWDKMYQKFIGNDVRANEFIAKYTAAFTNFKLLHLDHLSNFTASQIRDALMSRGSSEIITIKDYCKNFMSEFIDNSEKAKGTKGNYDKALKHFYNYLEEKKIIDIPLTKFDFELANKFCRSFLLTSNPKTKRIAMTEASAANIRKILVVIFKNAVTEKKIELNPFTGVKLDKSSPTKPKLTSIQIKALFNLDLSSNPLLDTIRDIFMFSCYLGHHYSDIMQLRKTYVQDFKEKGFYIDLERVKNAKPAKFFLVAQAAALIEKYSKSPDVKLEDRLVPFKDLNTYNEKLKLLAAMAGININLSTGIARHTFRQLIGEAEVKDIAVIKTMMGHSKKKDIDSVYHNVSEKQLFDAKELWQTYLDKILA